MVYGDLAEVPKTGIESEDVTQRCGYQSCVAQLQLQYGTEEVEQRQTTEYRGINGDANSQRLSTVSTTTYCEDQEFRKDIYLCRPRRINLAAPLNLSERRIKTWVRNWKKGRRL